MTVVPADHLWTLICDGCGDTVTDTAVVLPDAEVVWTLVFDHGWSGSPFASGPHHCPRCEMGGADRPGRSTAGDPLGLGRPDDAGAAPAWDEQPADRVRRALAEALDLGDEVLVDLSGVEVIDSAGLGLLVRAHQDARARSARLCLVAPSRFVRTVLHTMRLDGVFPVLEGPARSTATPVVSR
ncbi:STAS domain-containing protein [Micromonospora sp. PLK6-60]|uniref:STAS domain-containing protein n=1 Tax=Micromonospora sp. PLK6-60 TaxID=2873383 RepID=UPI001CA6973E|nr:STAS domain-containing protein [Micromonospora sp. PLK6-60]MBY8870456.1 STAS domain-containing protein [Micromonospora sp. PLK6-60]